MNTLCEIALWAKQILQGLFSQKKKNQREREMQIFSLEQADIYRNIYISEYIQEIIWELIYI